MIYYFSVNNEEKPSWLSYLESTLPDHTLTESELFIAYNDRINYLLGRKIVEQGLIELETGYNLHDIVISPFGKPILPNGLEFSISHSEHLVVGAFSTGQPIGIDTQFHKNIDWKEYIDFLNEEDLKAIYKASDQLVKFYDIWTKKESVVKLDGRGFQLSLKDIFLKPDKAFDAKSVRSWEIRKIHLQEKYSTAICAQDLQDKIEVKCLNHLK